MNSLLSDKADREHTYNAKQGYKIYERILSKGYMQVCNSKKHQQVGDGQDEGDLSSGTY